MNNRDFLKEFPTLNKEKNGKRIFQINTKTIKKNR